MTTARASTERVGLVRAGWSRKPLIFLLFFVLESAAFAIMPLSGLLPIQPLRYIQAALAAIFLVAALLLRRSASAKPYWQVLYAFFVASLAVLLSNLFSDDLLALLGFTLANPQGIAVAKFCESLLRVVAILALMAIVGADGPSMYLQKGRIGLGLAVGIAGFIILAALAFQPMIGQAGGTSTLLSALPWILLFVLSNGFMEELLYRGILLKRYEAFLGKGLSLLLSTVVFTLMHFQAGYVANVVQFLVLLFPLALIWGWLMQKTDSIWGSVIFHAGADCIIIFGIFASFSGM